jgi:SAM-dependent methyltransferase
MTGHDDRKRVWEQNIDSEVAFWRNFIRTRGGEWKDTWERRMNPDRPFPQHLRDLVVAGADEVIEALDVGCGPLTCLGKTWPGKTVRVTAVDPLADKYVQLFREAGVMPPTLPERCDGEQLLERFGPDSFHVAVAINSIDHSYDPVDVIRQMVAVIRVGGTVWLSHRVNEGEHEQYHGLHQWNFSADNGRFTIWKPGQRVDMTDVLGPRCSTRAQAGKEWVEVYITKLA